MLVSIALCTYNGEGYLEEQVLSILQQTYTQLQVVICDDASTDGTRRLLVKYASDKRITLLLNEQNLGPTKSFEKALAHCTGDFIAYADQDDIWRPEKIERMLQQIAGSPLLYHDSELVSADGKSLHKKISDLRTLYSGTDNRGFVFSNCVWGHAILFRRSLLKQLLPMPPNVPHDIWTAFVATCAGGIKNTGEVLVLYRQHNRTVTTTLPPSKVTRRKQQQKGAEYLKTRNWIRVMRDYVANPQKGFYERLEQLYKQRESGFSFPLFCFMLKHRQALFRFTKKSMLSQVNEIRKHSRGVRLD